MIGNRSQRAEAQALSRWWQMAARRSVHPRTDAVTVVLDIALVGAAYLIMLVARYEADEDVQELLNASAGLNLGVDFLPGAFGYDGTLPPSDTAEEQAATVLWLDAFCANVDRSWRNPNLLLWHRDLWVIDHGAALYFHHGWPGGLGDPDRFAAQPWDPDGHVLLAHASRLPAVDERVRSVITEEVLAEVLDLVPDAWLEPVPGAEGPAAQRSAYVGFLASRLGSSQWLPAVVA
jgi:hypothetical protein